MTNREGEPIEQAWRAEYAHLVDLSFRMLGEIGAAEDIAQEAFARLIDAGYEGIEDLRGWLIVVTTRLCLDRLRSARARRERVEQADAFAELPSPHDAGPVDPADRVTLDDQVRRALLVVLDRLSPGERVAFVLHEVFRVPFEQIALSTGRTEAGCRQLAHRARNKIMAEPAAAAASAQNAAARAVTDAFIKACATGDLNALTTLLAPDVHGEVVLGTDTPPPPAVRGAHLVAANLLRYWGHPATLVSHPSTDQPTLLAFRERRLAAVVLLTTEASAITAIHVIADAARLEPLAAELAARLEGTAP